MDPTTTLFTFMLHTHPSVQAVYLVGSWDNFSTPYAMERDSRRDRGQWRGCHSFKDIICDGDEGPSPSRDGGLKMGQTYYYYYELDGSTETHDPSHPTTTNCPYLPGQTVNTLWVPVQQSSRQRSASVNSMRATDLMTMDPRDKYSNPRPTPSAFGNAAVRYVASAASPIIRHKRSARSLSPNSSWSFSPRKLFSRKASSSSMPETDGSSSFYAAPSRNSSGDVSSPRPQSRDGRQSRDLSPDSLRRFLSDDAPLEAEPGPVERPVLTIPEDIAEENEDDDNFAISATSDSLHFTVLSPPPSQHSQSRCATPMASLEDETSASVEPAAAPAAPTRAPPRIPEFGQIALPSPPTSETFYIDSADTPASPESTTSNDIPSFYYSDDDEEEQDDDEDDGCQLPPVALGLDDTDSLQWRFSKSLSTYSLPLAPESADKDHHRSGAEPVAAQQLGSPALVAASGPDMSAARNSAALLASPLAKSGLDELVSELGWMRDIIRG